MRAGSDRGDTLPELLGGVEDHGDHRFDKGKGGTKLDVVNCVLEGGQEYDIVLAVRGNSVTSYVNGMLTNRLTLPENPAGGIELALWGSSTTVRFRDPRVRHF